MEEKLLCKGFRASGVVSGLKKKTGKDLGLIVSEVPATAAGVFTNNRVQAAPVLLDRERIRPGKGQAIVVNSGNANCCTGARGMEDARRMAKLAAQSLGISEDLVLVASTGVIGEPLSMEKVEAAVPALVRTLSADGFSDFADAIMTTDTFPKMLSGQGTLKGKPFGVVGIAKGSGMIRPDMATMLCFVCTDIGASPGFLKESLQKATERSFNRITVDGDTSTNDTILVLANGASGAAIETGEDGAAFQKVLDDVLFRLARLVVKDGEGATKLIEVTVAGAASDADARKIADTVSNSNLVKTAFFGQDANWGRILAAAGRAGVPMDPDRVDLYFDDVRMVKDGSGCGKDVEARATAVLKKPEFAVKLDLHLGSGTATVLTCDFSLDYVRINADYRS